MTKFLLALTFLFSSMAFCKGLDYSPDEFYKGIEDNPHVNCMSYALNIKREVPLNASSWFKNASKKDKVLANLISQINSFYEASLDLSKGPDLSAELKSYCKLSRDGRADSGYYVIAFYLSHSDDDEDGCVDDYHFLRQDSHGLWSHKNGRTIPTNLDALGRTIFNPQTANLRYEFSDESGELYADYQLMGYIQVPEN